MTIFLICLAAALISMTAQLLVFIKVKRPLLRALPTIVSIGIAAVIILIGFLNTANQLGWLILIGFVMLQAILLGLLLAWFASILRKIRS